MNTTAENQDYLWDRRHAVLYQVQLSVLYHRKRERFLAFWDRAVSAVAIIGGSAALADLGGAAVVKVAAAAVAVTATGGLVFALAERARRHAELAGRFLALEGRIRRAGERTFTEDQLSDWSAEVCDLEASEPPALGALVVACQNELAQASGQPDRMQRLSWWRQITMHFADYRLPV